MPEDMVEIKKGSQSDSVPCCDGNDYPWGTQIRMSDDMIDELGIGELSPGDVVRVSGFAFVESKSEHADKESSEKNMSLQMTFLKVKREEDDRAKQLYGG
jgi:hypothetical protein